MEEVNKYEARRKLRQNLKFIFLLVCLSLVAWFGVKMVVSSSLMIVKKSDTSAKQGNPILPLSGSGAPVPLDGSGGPSPMGGNSTFR